MNQVDLQKKNFETNGTSYTSSIHHSALLASFITQLHRWRLPLSYISSIFHLAILATFTTSVVFNTQQYLPPSYTSSTNYLVTLVVCTTLLHLLQFHSIIQSRASATAEKLDPDDHWLKLLCFQQQTQVMTRPIGTGQP